MRDTEYAAWCRGYSDGLRVTRVLEAVMRAWDSPQRFYEMAAAVREIRRILDNSEGIQHITNT